jgi:hypothetical protein
MSPVSWSIFAPSSPAPFAGNIPASVTAIPMNNRATDMVASFVYIWVAQAYDRFLFTQEVGCR